MVKENYTLKSCLFKQLYQLAFKRSTCNTLELWEIYLEKTTSCSKSILRASLRTQKSVALPIVYLLRFRQVSIA